MNKNNFKSSVVIRVDNDFYELVLNFIKDFESEMNVKISFNQATKIIAKKIIDAGGLIV